MRGTSPVVVSEHEYFMMKKSSIGTMQKAGAGLYVATTSEPGKSKKPTPNNEGKSYHKWTMQQRDLLLKECLFQQVWTAPHKQKQQTWSNICIILNNLPNIGDEFATVDWRKCQDEFTKNVELFLTSKDAHHFKSGTAEEHTVWQDLMEEITQLMYPDDHALELASVSLQEEDVKKAGELVRDEELSKFTKTHPKRKSYRTPKSTGKKYKVSTLDSGSSNDDQELVPMDRLCLALASRLEKENTSQATNNIPDKQEHPPLPIAPSPQGVVMDPVTYYISRFQTVEDVLLLSGIPDGPILQGYMANLTENGFDSPPMLLGIAGKPDTLLNRLGFRLGHAIRLANLLTQFIDDTGGNIPV